MVRPCDGTSPERTGPETKKWTVYPSISSLRFGDGLTIQTPREVGVETSRVIESFPSRVGVPSRHHIRPRPYTVPVGLRSYVSTGNDRGPKVFNEACTSQTTTVVTKTIGRLTRTACPVHLKSRTRVPPWWHLRPTPFPRRLNAESTKQGPTARGTGRCGVPCKGDEGVVGRRSVGSSGRGVGRDR